MRRWRRPWRRVALGLNWRLATTSTAFAEPDPFNLLYVTGVYTGSHDAISVQDIGIDNLTVADGPAVGRAGFCWSGRAACLTASIPCDDQTMYDIMLGWLAQEEGIRLVTASGGDGRHSAFAPPSRISSGMIQSDAARQRDASGMGKSGRHGKAGG